MSRIYSVVPVIGEDEALPAGLEAGAPAALPGAIRDGLSQIAQTLQGPSRTGGLDAPSHDVSYSLFAGTGFAGWQLAQAGIGAAFGWSGDGMPQGNHPTSGPFLQAFYDRQAKVSGVDTATSAESVGVLQTSFGAATGEVFGAAGLNGPTATVAAISLADIASGSGGFVIHGEDEYDQSGRSVASAGDVNGDGFDDLIVGAFLADGVGNAENVAGDSYVVFGKAGSFAASIDLADIAAGRGGFVIHGEDALDQSGCSVASAGDVNGDGFDDLIVGAHGADGAGNAEGDAGDSYVVFGKAGGFEASIDLADIASGNGGFVIHGEDPFDRFGDSVASAGDVNGDGFDDLIVGARNADGAGNAESGAGGSYVVFGKASGFAAGIDLADIAAGSGGFVIHGEDEDDRSGCSVASAGDVNGDGFDDLIVGANYADGAGNAESYAGGSYVVFGQAGGFAASIDLADIASGSGGFVIHGEDAYDRSGSSVASVGDVNGDGFDDLIVGAFGAEGAGNTKRYAGGSYIVFGKAGGFAASIDLADIAAGSGGFVIHGEDAFDSSGISVASAGDVNGDGFDDLIIGARLADGAGNAKGDAGDSYVVFGKSGGFAASIDLADIAAGSGGFVIHGEDADDYSGSSVASAGDVNGDGFDDLIVGAYRADGAGNAESTAGDSYVVFGQDFSLAVTHQGTSAADDLAGTSGADVMIGGQGNDTLSGEGRADALRGGAGNDVLIGQLGADRIDGGSGTDTADYGTSGSAVTVDLARNLNTGGDAQGDLLADIENLIGSSFGDSLTGNTAANRVYGGDDKDRLVGGAGNDTLSGGSGGDSLEGGSGNDSLDGGSGNDSMTGGAGNDRYVVNSSGDKVAEASSGGSDSVSSSVTFTLPSHVEKLTLTGTTAINGTGNTSNNTLTGNSAANSLSGGDGNDSLSGGDGKDGLVGGSGNDTLSGGSSSDSLDGGSGNDSLDGGSGNDSMTGGAGKDRYVVNSSGDKVIEASSGGSDSVSSSVTFTLPSYVEKLTLTGTTAINGTGNTSNNTLTGNSAANSLSGGDGNDSLSGGGGSDKLSGGNGHDLLDGGNGNDSLTGGAGNDTLTGGAGLDIFRFSSALNGSTNVDRLADFNVVDDRLQLENSVFTKLTSTGALSALNFRVSSSGNAADSNDFVLYETDTGQLFYDADGNDLGAKVLIAKLTGLPDLTSADIFVT